MGWDGMGALLLTSLLNPPSPCLVGGDTASWVVTSVLCGTWEAVSEGRILPEEEHLPPLPWDIPHP